MMWGLDLLGLARYAKTGRKAFPTGFALGVFADTFSDSRKAVRALLKTGKTPRVRVHLLWKDSHNYNDGDIKKAVRVAKKWKALIAEFLHIDWQISGACEHKKDAAWCHKMAAAILEVLPGVTYVNTPMAGGALIKGGNIINEVHGAHSAKPSGKYNFSYDGEACVDSNVEAAKEKYKSAETFWFWDARCNGKYESKDTTPRPKRTGWPDAKLIKSWAVLSRPRGECFLPNRNTFLKSHAENDGKGDLKAEKNCLISPIKTSKFEYRRNGKVIATLRYFGTFDGGGYRYYSAKMGWQISTTPVELWADGKKYGTLNPAFRFNVYRH